MLSTTAEYALRIMVVLAEFNGAPTTSERIAKITGVPPDYSVKVLQMLAKAGLVRAQRGRGGGFRLQREPESVTLLQVIDAIDPLCGFDRCPVGAEDERDELCGLHRRMDEVIRDTQARFGAITLRDVVDSHPERALCAPPTPEVTVARRGAASKQPASSRTPSPHAASPPPPGSRAAPPTGG